MQDPRDLTTQECERLLRAGVVGRVALSTPDGPHIVPVNYSVHDDTVVLRTSSYSVLGTYGRNAMLAFEIDHIDHDRHLGWSVVARGRSWAEVDPAGAARDPPRLGAAAVGERQPQPLPPAPVGHPDRSRPRQRLVPPQRVAGPSHADRHSDWQDDPDDLGDRILTETTTGTRHELLPRGTRR